MYPRIETIDDVLPHLGENIGIYVNRRAGYRTVDYGWVGDTTFDRPMRIECRGLKFGEDGRLLARPFHKFFNLGEREGVADIDWTRPHA